MKKQLKAPRGNSEQNLPIDDSISLNKEFYETEENEDHNKVSGLVCDKNEVWNYEQYVTHNNLENSFLSLIKVEERIGQLLLEGRYFSEQDNLTSEEVRRMEKNNCEYEMHEVFAGQFFGACLIKLLPKCEWCRRHDVMYILGLNNSGIKLKYNCYINLNEMANSILIGKKSNAFTDFLSRALAFVNKSVE
jgi:hypothetical protein